MKEIRSTDEFDIVLKAAVGKLVIGLPRHPFLFFNSFVVVSSLSLSLNEQSKCMLHGARYATESAL